jgi:hypothetical protein
LSRPFINARGCASARAHAYAYASARVRTRERSRVHAHAHAYARLAEAADRVRFLRERGFRARTVAVLAMPDDTAASIGDVTPRPPGQE